MRTDRYLFERHEANSSCLIHVEESLRASQYKGMIAAQQYKKPRRKGIIF